MSVLKELELLIVHRIILLHILKNVMINHIYSGKLHLSVSLTSSSPQNHSTYIMKVFL